MMLWFKILSRSRFGSCSLSYTVHGYIVFVFSVIMFVYVFVFCVVLFFHQRILRKYTYDFEIWCKGRVRLVVLCKRESAFYCLPFPFRPFCFLSSQFFCYRFLGCNEGQSAQILYTSWEWTVRFICPSFPPFLFSISHASVIHMDILFKNFSGTTVSRLSKFKYTCTYVWLWFFFFMFWERESASFFLSLLLCVHFSFSRIKISVIYFLAHWWEPVFTNFVYTLSVAKCIVGKKAKLLRFILAFFFCFTFVSSVTPVLYPFSQNYM